MARARIRATTANHQPLKTQTFQLIFPKNFFFPLFLLSSSHHTTHNIHKVEDRLKKATEEEETSETA